eukprot:COSAG02_NODE_239_length_27693_cov_31.385700_8_plen_44_part_00
MGVGVQSHAVRDLDPVLWNLCDRTSDHLLYLQILYWQIYIDLD